MRREWYRFVVSVGMIDDSTALMCLYNARCFGHILIANQSDTAGTVVIPTSDPIRQRRTSALCSPRLRVLASLSTHHVNHYKMKTNTFCNDYDFRRVFPHFHTTPPNPPQPSNLVTCTLLTHAVRVKGHPEQSHSLLLMKIARTAAAQGNLVKVCIHGTSP